MASRLCGALTMRDALLPPSAAAAAAAAAAEPPLRVCTKLAFAIGGVGGQIAGTIASFFLNPWLLTVVGLRPALVGAILLSGRLWDAFTDPIIGHWSDRTRTRWGRRRPWMAGAAVPCSLSYLALFTAPELFGLELRTQGAKFAWYCGAYWSYQLAFTVYFIPYSSLTMELSAVPRERDSATLWRMVLELLGTMAGTLFQGFLIAAMAPEGATIPEQQRAYLVAAVAVAGAVLLFNTTTVVGVRERPLPPPEAVGAPKPSRCAGMRVAMASKPYLLLNFSYLCTWLCFQVLSTNLVLYLQYTLNIYSEFQFILGTVLGAASVFMILISLLMRLLEKRTCYALGMLSFMPFSLALLFLPELAPALGAPPEPRWLIYVVAAGAGIGVATSFLLPWSLLPDTVDDSERQTHERHEGMLYALFVFFGKLAGSLSLGLSSLALDFSGFDAELEVQPPQVGWTLRVLVGLVPAVLAVGTVVALYFYPIDEVRRKETAQILRQRKQAEAAAQDVAAAAGGAASDSAASASSSSAAVAAVVVTSDAGPPGHGLQQAEVKM
jgi:Na+/melibiose symporter-like transporter